MHLVTQVEAAAFLYYEIQLVKNVLLSRDNSIGSLLNSDSPFFCCSTQRSENGKNPLEVKRAEVTSKRLVYIFIAFRSTSLIYRI